VISPKSKEEWDIVKENIHVKYALKEALIDRILTGLY
jgi:hypothetical protein